VNVQVRPPLQEIEPPPLVLMRSLKLRMSSEVFTVPSDPILPLNSRVRLLPKGAILLAEGSPK
jgi:hypothetical protein